MKSLYERILDASCHVSCTGVRIYNLLREVGHGKIKPECALLQLVEEYKNNGDQLEELRKIGKAVDKLEKFQLEKVVKPYVAELIGIGGRAKKCAERMTCAMTSAIAEYQEEAIK